MPNTNFVTAVENNSLLEAHEMLEKTLYRKAGTFLEEKKKAVAAKVWPSPVITESTEKEMQKAARRKALKDKLKKPSVKKEEAY